MPSDSERWVQVSVPTHSDAADDLGTILGRNCAGGTAVEESLAEHQGKPGWVLVKGWFPASDRETHQRLEIALLLLSHDESIGEPVFQELAYEDWASSWKQHFRPLRIGRRTVIVPSWCAFAAQPDDVVLTLDPGMAFGTGLHATTRLCLRALEAYSPQERRVLDVGCGSGILAIAAALQGAAKVDAIDVDKVAVTAARENVARNHVADRVHVAWGTLPSTIPSRAPEHRGSDYDVVLANILAEVIASMAPALAAATRPGGILILSGILAEKANMVVESMAQANVSIVEQPREGDWVALIGQKR